MAHREKRQTNVLYDTTTGTINIGHGSSPPPSNSGFFGSGFTNTGSSSNRRRRRRLHAQAARQAAEARARAEAQALREQAVAAHRQLIEILTQQYKTTKATIDSAYSAKSANLNQLLESEIRAAKTKIDFSNKDDRQLYFISKEKSETDGLITKKANELQAKNAHATSFDGHNPLTRTEKDYRDSLTQHSAHNPVAANDAHKQWESAYSAGHEAKILSDSIRLLNAKSQALAARHAEVKIKLREGEAIQEGYRQQAQQREEHINYTRRVDEDTRRNLIKAANTFVIPVTPAIAGVLVADSVTAAMASTVRAAVAEIIRIAAIPAGQTLALAVTTTLYSPTLGNGELTPEQRRRLFPGIGVNADVFGLPKNADLPAIANARGSVELNHRIKPVPVSAGTELHVVSTGKAISANVPVINAVFDPLTDTYRAETNSSPAKHLIFNPSASASDATTLVGTATQPDLFTTKPQAVEVPSGVDTRINDCIVCFPPALGLPPQYFSFERDPIGSGIVTGAGQPASADWWKEATQQRGATIPGQIGDRYRSREFKSFEAFDNAVWRAVAEDPTLTMPFDTLNRKRLARGFAPYAPKATWVGERREFEIRHREAADGGAAPFDLDKLNITHPNGAHGIRRVTPSFLPWPVSSGTRTWTPLIPPGSESLGSTELPITPGQPTVYPGDTLDPVRSQNESLPAVDPTDINANIPGYGADDDLPSPGAVFVGPPVEPLEVGPYNELSGRSRLDGLDIDHIVSRQALKGHILRIEPMISTSDLNFYLRRAPSITIPTEVHRKFSETYGGRNTQTKQAEDARNLRTAVDSNLNAIKSGLLEAGFEEAQIEKAREMLHKLNNAQGWYE